MSKPLIECYKEYSKIIDDKKEKEIILEVVKIMESSPEFVPDGATILRERFSDLGSGFIAKVLKGVRTFQKENASIFFIAEELQ